MSLFRKLTETVSKGVSTATEKAQQTVEITRLHAQITGKRKEIHNRMAEIGKKVYEGYLANDLLMEESQIIPACEQIKAIQKEIDVLENRLMELRNEKECACGKKVPYDARYCPSCGTRFPEPLVIASEADDHDAPPLQLPEGESAASAPETLDAFGADGEKDDPPSTSKT